MVVLIIIAHGRDRAIDGVYSTVNRSPKKVIYWSNGTIQGLTVQENLHGMHKGLCVPRELNE